MTGSAVRVQPPDQLCVRGSDCVGCCRSVSVGWRRLRVVPCRGWATATTSSTTSPSPPSSSVRKFNTASESTDQDMGREDGRFQSMEGGGNGCKPSKRGICVSSSRRVGEALSLSLSHFCRHAREHRVPPGLRAQRGRDGQGAAARQRLHTGTAPTDFSTRDRAHFQPLLSRWVKDSTDAEHLRVE